jgi:uncharacterized protein YgfB (UPF0149 family)
MEKLNETNTSLDTSSFGINLCSIDNDNRNMTGAVSQLLNSFIIGFGILVKFQSSMFHAPGSKEQTVLLESQLKYH